ncbi:MAG: RNA polymerase sigma factor [Actinomycetota bacterium]
MADTELLASPEDLQLVERLRAGDEDAFMMLVEQHQAMMLRIARMYVSSQAVAEEVVQDAWLGILQGLDKFEGRSSLRTWMYRILANIAKTRGQREGRSQPFSSLIDADAGPAMPNRGSAARVISGQAGGRRSRPTGGAFLRTSCSRRRRSASWVRRSTNFRPSRPR